MRNKILKSIRLLFAIAFAVSFSQCNIFAMLDASSLLLGGNFIGSAASNDGISETESDLLAEGPIDLPVTIAKLESPDANLLDISELSGGSNLVKERPLYQSGGRTIRIKGLPEAIRAVDDQPVVVGFPYDQISELVGSQVTVTVNTDGSFSIDVATNGDALVASGDGDSSISPFLQITEDPDTGYFIIITTNSSQINTNTQMAVDSDDYYYITFETGAGLQSLVRRNVDGSAVQEIITDSTRLIDGLVVRSSFKSVYTYAKSSNVGSLTLQLTSIISNSVSASETSQPASSPALRYAEVVSFSLELDEVTPYDFSTNNLKIYLNSDEEGVIVINRDSPDIQFINTTSSSAVDVIRSGVYDDVHAAYDVNNNDLFVWILNSGLYSLYKVDLDNDPSFAWGLREAVLEFQDFSSVNSMEAANGVLTFSISDGAENKIYYYNEDDGVTFIDDSEVDTLTLTNLKISTDGAKLFACSVDGQFYYSNVSSPGFNPITTDSDYTVCNSQSRSYYVTPTFLHFYRNDGIASQHAMINISQLP